LAKTLAPLWTAALALAGILIGFLVAYALQVPRTSRLRHAADYGSRALHAARLEAILAAAVIEAQNGRYEIGRRRASDFFTGLQRRVVPAVSEEAGPASRQLLERRDAIITTLARSDPASPSVLGEALAQYRDLVRRAGLDSVVAPPPVR
jgi:hypothetical protein